MSKKWYVVHTYSGHEGKVREHLMERFNSLGLKEKVGDLLIPMEDVVEIRQGKKIVSTRKFFPGYLLINMEIDDEIWYLIKNTPKVTGFLGDANKPTPLDDSEIEKIMEQLRGAAEKPKPKVGYEQGENVRVIDGPFANFTGVIDEVNLDRGKVKLMVSIFGRATPVELEFPQIEKI